MEGSHAPLRWESTFDLAKFLKCLGGPTTLPDQSEDKIKLDLKPAALDHVPTELHLSCAVHQLQEICSQAVPTMWLKIREIAR